MRERSAATVDWEWITIGDGVLGESVRIPRFSSRGRASTPRVVLVSGFRPDDVLGPEVLRAIYRELDEGVLDWELVGWPLLPSRYLSRGAEAVLGNSDGVSSLVEQLIVESYEGAHAVIHLTSPAETEAAPYAVIPPREAFPHDAAFDSSARLAAALDSVYAIRDVRPSALGSAAARKGIPFVEIVAGVRGSATRELRSELRQRLGQVLEAAAGSAGSAGQPSRIETVHAREAGFLHLRSSLGEVISQDKAIAATWAFEPDSVEEFFMRAGRVLELSRKGRVEAGDVIARSVTATE